MIRAMVYLSKLNKNSYIMIKEISDKTGIPYPFLSKIFQDLSKTKWIESKKGKNGGVKLISDTGKITLMDIISLNSGYPGKEACLFGNKDCGAKYRCELHSKCDLLKEHIFDFLTTTTIEDFSKKWNFDVNDSNNSQQTIQPT